MPYPYPDERRENQRSRDAGWRKLNDQESGELDDLLALDSGLTPWEVEFVDAMAGRRGDKQEFSRKQRIVLKKLWDKLCS